MVAIEVAPGIYLYIPITPLEAWWLTAYPDGCATN